MPSPCEFDPNQEVAVIQYEGQAVAVISHSATRVIPAIVGGLFAGLLLVGLGCTPLFTPQTARAKPEVFSMVTASAAPGSVDGMLVVGGHNAASKSPTGNSPPAPPASAPDASADAAQPAPSSAAPSAAPAPAPSAPATMSSSSAQNGTHRFSINCEPSHAAEDRNVLRPESVALQGILAGQTSKAALLNGELYREGDRFGSALCPWTVAMIDPASVRIEKTFGDRICGVTIHLKRPDKPTVTMSSSPTHAKPRSGAISAAKSR